jgi:hypothetical protein
MCVFLHIDIIFFIYLYQRYIYPVDCKRTNEFGTTGEHMRDHTQVHRNSSELSRQLLSSSQNECLHANTLIDQHDKCD